MNRVFQKDLNHAEDIVNKLNAFDKSVVVSPERVELFFESFYGWYKNVTHLRPRHFLTWNVVHESIPPLPSTSSTELPSLYFPTTCCQTDDEDDDDDDENDDGNDYGKGYPHELYPQTRKHEANVLRKNMKRVVGEKDAADGRDGSGPGCSSTRCDEKDFDAYPERPFHVHMAARVLPQSMLYENKYIALKYWKTTHYTCDTTTDHIIDSIVIFHFGQLKKNFELNTDLLLNIHREDNRAFYYYVDCYIQIVYINQLHQNV